MTRLGAMGAACLALLAGAGGCAHLRPPGHLPLGAPFRLEVEDLAGHPVSIRPAPGKVTVVVFWASWCARCLDRLADARRLAATATDVDLVAVNLDADRRFAVWDARRLGLPRPVLWDRSARAATALGVRALPTILFIGRDGRLRRALEGVQPDARFRLRRALAQVLEGDGRQGAAGGLQPGRLSCIAR